ncbi:MAG: hypothetical protein NWS46_09485 [Cyclobacteriaceae bacterium]|jgi:hypothetical protein|nr:hypothetical protein [Cyclobacteriaceae bacterium]
MESNAGAPKVHKSVQGFVTAMQDQRISKVLNALHSSSDKKWHR